MNNVKYIEKRNLKKFEESEAFFKIFYILGPAMYLSFSIADWLLYNSNFYTFLAIRLFFCLGVIATFLINQKNKSFVKNQKLQIMLTFIGSSGIALMMYLTDGPMSIFTFGINLVAIMSLIFYVYDIKYFCLALVASYTPYYVLSVFDSNRISSLGEYLAYNFFNVGTIVAIVFMHLVREKDFQKVIQAELLLEDEIKNREKIISQKTEESMHLAQLSSQFSPQVVKAIKNGTISLDQEVHRSKICAIFVDIVNSTERVTRLDQSKIQATISRFLDTCLTIFLKYDLTIDKFQGDGVLAFSNDPVKRDDYIERTCLAAYEVVEAIKNDRDFYICNWKNELEVRVGIAVGYANVGFYGDKKYFKSYTAIGTPLPLASRLTSIAEVNQILVDADVAEVLVRSDFKVTNLGPKILKGFEQDKSIVYSLDAIPELSMLNSKNKDVHICPIHADSVMYLDTNKDGHYIFQCRICDMNNEDVVDSIAIEKAS